MKNKLILVSILTLSSVASVTLMWLVWTGIFMVMEYTA